MFPSFISKFEPSAFWKVFGRLPLGAFLGAILIILACFECTARLAPLLIERQVHQKFLYSSRICEVPCQNQGKRLLWMANSAGARGALHSKREPLKVAVFGSSTSAGSLLDQDETWPEQFRHAFTNRPCQVDNYARGGGTNRETMFLLKDFNESGRMHDIAILMIHSALPPWPESEAAVHAYHYWGGFVPDSGILAISGLPHIFRARVRQEINGRPLLSWLRDQLKGDQSESRTVSWHMTNRELRNQGLVEFVDVPVDASGETMDPRRQRTRELVRLAKANARLVVWVTQPVAYHPEEHPGVSRRWYSLYPVPGTNAFMSNKSWAEQLRANNAAMAEVAAEEGVLVVDLDAYLAPFLKDRDDLFDDKWHLAPAGAAMAGAFIAEKIHAHQDTPGAKDG
jgi:lysophospholipase L1-like esterase